MKHSQTCPKCACRRFLVTAEFRYPDPGAGNHTYAMPAFTAKLGRAYAEAGKLETWTCASCGYTEFYAVGLEQLDLARLGGAVVYFDASAPVGPTYR